MRVARYGLAVVCSLLTVACGKDAGDSPVPGAPTAPSGAPAAPDGSTLKASIPVPASPRDSVRIETLRPALTFANSTGRFTQATFTYRVELYEGTTLASTLTVPQAAGAQSTVALDADLQYDTLYRWRVRAEQGAAATAYSGFVDFVTPQPPRVSGGFGRQRDIGFDEAFAIIVDVHNGERWNLGSGSTRDERVRFLWRAVGIIHFGHPAFNPAGGDPDWCVKDAGGGRPPSDDVLVRCSTREAWDLIGGAGANGYRFHEDYLGRLGSEQNVYPPPVPAGAGAGLPPDPNRPPLPDVRGLIAQFNAERPGLMNESCPNGLKYVNNPWQDYIVDRLRQTDPRWGYNAKPTRGPGDNNGVPVIAAGDELAYYYGSGVAQGSDQVYLVDILESHCGTPRLTWRVFTGEEPGIWTGAGRF